MQEFQIKGADYIQLNQLLKAIGIVFSGGEAKMLIHEGAVRVNNEIEKRVRKKIVKGDVVKVGQHTITITS